MTLRELHERLEELLDQDIDPETEVCLWDWLDETLDPVKKVYLDNCTDVIRLD